MNKGNDVKATVVKSSSLEVFDGDIHLSQEACNRAGFDLETAPGEAVLRDQEEMSPKVHKAICQLLDVLDLTTGIEREYVFNGIDDMCQRIRVLRLLSGK